MSYEVPFGEDNPSSDYLGLDPVTMTHRENPKPGTPMQRMDINKPTNQDGSRDKNLQSPDASLKKVYCLLVFVIVVYGALMLVFGVMGIFRGEGKVGPKGDIGPQGSSAPDAGTGSSSYIRWGRTECNSTASLIYAGIAGGKHYAHPGSGSNYLCLPEEPEYDDYQAGQSDQRALVYSAEYQSYDFPYAGQHDHDVPCAVCHTTIRGTVLMIPAKITCPTGWTREYHGYLMAERYIAGRSSTEFVCVDRYPESIGSTANADGALFYPVESRCDGSFAGNLPCGPYVDGAELSCVVCSK